MTRRITKTAPAAYQMPRMQITSDALPGVTIFSVAALTDGSLNPYVRQHAVVASYEIHRDPEILRAELYDGCELTDWEIDQVVATGVLPSVGIGWTAAMAADASRAADVVVDVNTSLSSLLTLAESVRQHVDETTIDRIAA